MGTVYEDCTRRTTYDDIRPCRCSGKEGAKELIDERWQAPHHQDMVRTCHLCKDRAKEWEEKLNTALFDVARFSSIR
ncbi:hypothetical protein NMY22_g16458 [Coprinellus aureogranulatus]|nr:hypothetical protein NMY22_g16458 [Coprinellus aureogranulatus]